MKRAHATVSVITAFGALGGACTLNPQPFPPASSTPTGELDAGPGGFDFGDGAGRAGDAGVADVNPSEDGSPITSNLEASAVVDAPNDALGEVDASDRTDASGDSPDESVGPDDDVWNAQTRTSE